MCKPSDAPFVRIEARKEDERTPEGCTSFPFVQVCEKTGCETNVWAQEEAGRDGSQQYRKQGNGAE